MKLKALEERLNTKQKIKYIDEDGYLYSLSLDDINDKRNTSHWIFSCRNPYTIYNINNYIKINDISTTLLSKEFEYSAQNKHLKFKCGMCGDVFERTWSHFYNNKYKYCSKCIFKVNASKRKFTIEQIKEKCFEKGLKVLQNEYFGNQKPLDIEDKDGYRGRVSWNDVQNNKSFIRFRIGNPYFYYNIRNYFKINNFNCDIIENSGVERRGKFTFICECGKHYDSYLNAVLNSKNPRVRCMSCTNSISNGEKAIIDWLKKNKINYIYQFCFDDCKDKRKLPFDFYLPKYNICIEFDGAYHYKKQPHITEEKFKSQLERDKIKNQYCEDNNIKLIRIPYWKLYNNKYKNILKENILM